MRRPTRFVGLHFFNPVPLMALVEVVRGRQTDDATVEATAPSPSAWARHPSWSRTLLGLSSIASSAPC